jgi:oligosaccharide repeat unit polymerase
MRGGHPLVRVGTQVERPWGSMSYTLINTVCLSIVALILFSLWRRTHDLLSCANIFSACFSLPVLGSQVWCRLTENAFNPSPKTVLLLYTGWIAFLLGMAFAVRKLPHRLGEAEITPVGRYAKAVLVALMLAHVAFTLAVSSSTGLFATFRLTDLVGSLAANRLNLSGDFTSAHVGWFFEAWHTAYVYYVPLAAFLYRQQQISKRSLVSVCCLAGALSLVLFSRVPFLMLLVYGLVAWTLLFRTTARQLACISGLLLFAAVALFAGMQAVLANVDVNSNSLLSDQLGTYAVSSGLAFQEVLNGNYDEANPHDALYVATGIYYILGKLSLLNAEEYPGSYQTYVFVPYPTNVYTFLFNFALDFGTIGIILGPFVMGIGMAWVYNRVRIRVTYPRLLLYGLCVYTCCIVNLGTSCARLPSRSFSALSFFFGPCYCPARGQELSCLAQDTRHY